MDASATARKNARRRRKPKLSQLILYAVLTLWGVTTVYPFIWVLLNAFKHRGLIRSDSFSLPVGDRFTLDNFTTAFERLDIFGAYMNSIIISVTVTLVVMVLAGFAAYALARYVFKGKTALYSLVIASMMFPVFSTIIPVFRMLFKLGIANTYSVPLSLISVILPQIAGNLSFSIVVLIGFIRSLPIELEESAFLEGCNSFQIFFKIIVPIAKPSFATVAIFTFLWSYNDLFTQMYFLRYRDQYSIVRLMNEIQSIAGLNYGLMCAAVALVVVPVLIVYVFLQKHIIKGLTAGAIKG